MLKKFEVPNPESRVRNAGLACRETAPRLSLWVSVGVCLLATLGGAQTVPVVDTSHSAHAQVRPVGLEEVAWTEGFWAQRFAVCRTNTLPGLRAIMEGTNYSQFYKNFRIAAGLDQGQSRGPSFNDGDFYKWLEGACALLEVTHDPALGQRIDEIVEVIAKAQRPDGYIFTHTQIKQLHGDTSVAPFHDPVQFEMYNLGHLMTAGCIHYRVTGKTNLLAAACKAADCIDKAFAHPTPEQARNLICPSHYMGLVELYRTTQDKHYLELAQRIFAQRKLVIDGDDDNQDRIPFEEQCCASGHAVRANYLYAGAADLYLETGDAAYWTPLESIWTNVVQHKMYITGGCGALFDGASPEGSKDQKHITRVHQAYGRDYQLPNTTAHNETCANIANVLWNWRMFLASGQGQFMDVAELALYNSVLSGESLDGTNYFYVNPLRTTDPLPVPLRWQHKRVPFISTFCCPPNLMRTIAELSGYAYSKSEDALWVNLYGANHLSTTLGQGQALRLSQETAYPWDGRVRLRFEACGAEPFALKLRIPGWAEKATLLVNGAPVSAALVPGRYSEVRRSWKAGDVVELNLAMPVRLMEANPLVEEVLDQVAVQRGPVVYCLESADLPKGMKVLDVRLPRNIDLTARFDGRLLGGVVVMEGTALSHSSAESWKGSLYRAAKPTVDKPVHVRLVPYFAWDNRGSGEMSVWLPTAAGSAPDSKAP